MCNLHSEISYDQASSNRKPSSGVRGLNPPEKLYRVDSDHIKCPECGERFISRVKDVR
jgi:predicted RNA-binding Zn-ribbon protein involved in translation (DUF1610 family)